MAEDEGLGTGQVVPITVADLLGYSAGTQPSGSGGGSSGGSGGGGGGGGDDEAARRRQEERRKKEKAAAAKKAAEEAARKKAAAAAASQHQVQPAAARHHEQPQIRQQQKKSTTQPRGARDATRPTARTLQSARPDDRRQALRPDRRSDRSRSSLGQHGHPDPRRFDPTGDRNAVRVSRHHEARVGVTLTTGVSAKRAAPPVRLRGLGFPVVARAVAEGRVNVAARVKPGKINVSFDPRHGGKIAAHSKYVDLSDSHLYSAARHVREGQLARLAEAAVGRKSNTASQRLALPRLPENVSVGGHVHQKIFRGGELSLSIEPGRHGHIAVIEVRLSVDTKIREKNGRAISVQTEIAITTTLDMGQRKRPVPKLSPREVAALAAIAAAAVLVAAVGSPGPRNPLEGSPRPESA